jgi:hypothetical protein
MKPDSRNCVLDLQPVQILRLRAASGVTIRCDSGMMWITQEGRASDDFLSAGDSLCISSSGMTLIEAMGDAAARLTLRRSASGCAPGIFRPRAAV